MIRAIFLLLAMALPVAAQDLAPPLSPKPVANLNREDVAGQNGKVPPALDATTKPSPDETAQIGMRDQLRETDAEYAACTATLSEMGVVFTEVDPLVAEDDADCGILRPLLITEISPGVAIVPAATIRCDTAQAISIWTRDFVLPASKRLSERGALVTIENGSGYICRRRNNLPTGKLSQHAFGNAFDVMGFQFEDGSRLAIEPREAEGSMAEAFQDAVRAAACLDFTTVLGPGSNASHADHLHIDIIARESGYRLCEQGGIETD